MPEIEQPVFVNRLPPCNHACPAGEDIQRWVLHAGSGDYRAAWKSLVENNPFPAIMGRISDASNIQTAFLVPLICYVYILYFAVKGYKPVTTASPAAAVAGAEAQGS